MRRSPDSPPRNRRPASPARPIVLAGLAGVLLTACGDLPRPYAHRDLARLENPLVALKSGEGVSVPPVQGLPVPWNRLVALEAVDLLHGYGIPAETGGRAPLGQTLIWEARVPDTTPPPGEPRQLHLTWHLKDGSGDTITVPVSAELWDRAAPEAARALARPVVGALALALGSAPDESRRPEAIAQAQPPLPVGSPAAPPARRAPPAKLSPEEQKRETQRKTEAATVVALKPRIVRAPGDGVEALTRSLTALIAAAGVRLTDVPEKATFALVGTVTTEPVAGKKEKVTLVWEVQDPVSGAVAGTAVQENIIPAGLLDKPWGALADRIAAGALEGVGEILAAPPP